MQEVDCTQELKDGAKIGQGLVILMKQHGHLAGQQHSSCNTASIKVCHS